MKNERIHTVKYRVKTSHNYFVNRIKTNKDEKSLEVIYKNLLKLNRGQATILILQLVVYESRKNTELLSYETL